MQKGGVAGRVQGLMRFGRTLIRREFPVAFGSKEGLRDPHLTVPASRFAKWRPSPVQNPVTNAFYLSNYSKLTKARAHPPNHSGNRIFQNFLCLFRINKFETVLLLNPEFYLYLTSCLICVAIISQSSHLLTSLSLFYLCGIKQCMQQTMYRAGALFSQFAKQAQLRREPFGTSELNY